MGTLVPGRFLDIDGGDFAVVDDNRPSWVTSVASYQPGWLAMNDGLMLVALGPCSVVDEPGFGSSLRRPDTSGAPSSQAARRNDVGRTGLLGRLRVVTRLRSLDTAKPPM